MTDRTIKPVILCGGSGTRLWPLSTDARPKQYLDLLSDRSMVQMTRERVSGKAGELVFSAPLAIGALRHRAHLQKILLDVETILEPFGRNSAPAIAAACVCSHPEDILLVLPADHGIADVGAFHAALEKGYGLAEAGSIVTFGIEPTYPATGYGYIRSGATTGNGLAVDAFVEKPDAVTARSYLDEGRYLWNAGIFMFRVSVMAEALDRFEPGMLQAVGEALCEPEGTIRRLDGETFAGVRSISIDHAVMERAASLVTVPVSMGWNDIGGFEALHGLLADGADGNVIEGPVALSASEGSYVRSEGRPVFASGLEDIVVVATDDAVMIAPKADAAAVKSMAETFQNDRDRLNIPKDLCEQAESFLKAAFRLWCDAGWDEAKGGFVEHLSRAGKPARQATIITGVQAGQIYNFSTAAKRGWIEKEGARSLVEKGIGLLAQPALRTAGGWMHSFSPAGNGIDTARHLHDHASLIRAGAAAWDAFQIAEAREMASEALAFVTGQLADEANGGWFDTVPGPAEHRASSHMHLLEAMLELGRATDSDHAREIAGAVVGLFEERFFRAGSDDIVERFTTDWSPNCGAKPEIDRGACYQWASLLTYYQRWTGHDTLSWQRRLICRADEIAGRGAATPVNLEGELRKLKAHLLHPALGPEGQREKLFSSICATYLHDRSGGVWGENTDEKGNGASNGLSARMLCLFVEAFGIIAP